MIRMTRGWTTNADYRWVGNVFKLTIPISDIAIVKSAKYCPKNKEIVVEGWSYEPKNNTVYDPFYLDLPRAELK